MNLGFLYENEFGTLKLQVENDAQSFADSGAVRLHQEIVNVHFGGSAFAPVGLEGIDMNSQ